MAAPVLLRVSVPRWERVARYAVCAAGILLSIYAYHVEREKERDPEHRALCDLGPWVKCSAALASRYPGWGSGPGTAERGEGGGWGRGARGWSWAWDRWVPGRGGTRGAASGTRPAAGGSGSGVAQDQAAGAEVAGPRDRRGGMRWQCSREAGAHQDSGRPGRSGRFAQAGSWRAGHLSWLSLGKAGGGVRPCGRERAGGRCPPLVSDRAAEAVQPAWARGGFSHCLPRSRTGVFVVRPLCGL